MFFALLTAWCWSLGGFASSRIARFFGSAPANAYRLALATLGLGLIVLVTGASFGLQTWKTFMLAGFLHLCLGDVALFACYRRLGPRLGVLMVCSLAPPTALIAEWSLQGTRISGEHLFLAGGILCMVIFAVAPRERRHLSPQELKLGLGAGLLAGGAQGVAAAVNRVAFSGLETVPSPWTAAFYRVGAGAFGVAVWLLWKQVRGAQPFHRPPQLFSDQKISGHPYFWLGLSTLMGPMVGMMFLMRAFEAAPAVLVQSTLATLPVFMIPVAWLLDGTVPSKRSLIAGTAAVGLTVTLVMSG